MHRNLRALWPPRDPVAWAQLVTIVLLAANLAGAWLVLRPPGGSPDELRAELSSMRAQVVQQRNLLARSRLLSTRVETGRAQDQRFMSQYFLDQRTAASTVAAGLIDNAKEAGVKLKDAAYPTEPVEGSDSLSMMTVSANFEGNYPDLIHLLDRIDKSSRLVLIESLQAVPEQGSNRLNISLRFNVFVRGSGENLVAELRP
jgi:hypothetical protein